MESPALPQWSAETRQRDLARLRQGGEIYDAVIVGGGIVGVGAARDLALRGLKVALFEMNDFAWGTSSKSSKLIHGGLRYLEMLDFGLVFEALSERHWLLKTNPHLVHPLRFVFPIYDGAHTPPGARPAALMQLGMWLYDGLALFRTPFFHGKYSDAEMKKFYPGLSDEGLQYGLYYADAMMRDDEMVLECALDAVRHGATCLSRARVDTVKKNASGLYDVAVSDVFAQGGGQGPFTVQGREVIVCAGPWTERFGARVPSGAGKKLKPSRGIHLVVPWKRFPVDGCLVMSMPDQRIVFVIPRKDLGDGAEKVIIGTTDAPEPGDPGMVEANRGEVEYLLAALTKFFPGAKLTAADIKQTYCGVRPLIDDGNDVEAKTSREHEIWRNGDGIVFVAGGKYTTFRPMSAEISDFAFPQTKEGDSKAALSDPAEYEARFSGAPLWGRYTEGWLRWCLGHHQALTLEDIVFRRTPLWMEGEGLSDALLKRVAAIAAEKLGWDRARLDGEIKSVRVKLAAGSAWKRG